MKLFGLTGGIGMGKSTAANYLRSRTIAVIDTDDLAREIVQPGQPALAEIREAFGAQLIDATGQLRREALAEIVFNDPAARLQLEAITHPRITAQWRQQCQLWRGQDVALAVVVIPLLFETKVESEFDAIICLACSASTQRQRLAARGWSEAAMEARCSAQMSVGEKMARANFVVWTEGAPAVLARQLDQIVAR